YSVSFGSALWQMHQTSIEVPHGATDLAAALEEAMAAANDTSEWKAADDCGPTFVDALAEGADPWRNDARDHIPEALTEEGPKPIVLIRMAGGRIDDVKLVRGEADVVAVNRDGEALDRGPHITVEDEQGELLLTHWTGGDDLSSLPGALIDELGLSAPGSDPPA
ncbi:MAG: hypothetical protein OEU92_31885, partial [Alphaproteobacteria bacterium]|nr:hypothetical protein [Alphaproteobacteria bacterium]